MSRFRREELKKIATRAKTLQERIKADGVGSEASEHDLNNIEKWREYVADGEAARFRERLDREGWTLHECKERITFEDWPANEELPDWVKVLDDIVEYVQDTRTDELEQNDEVPFYHVLEPFVSYAHSRLTRSTVDVLSESAADDLAESLSEQLSAISSHTLFIEFQTYLETEFEDREGTVMGESSTDCYEEFTVHTVENIKDLFLEYSFLGRMIVTMIEQWIATAEEMCNRVVDDWQSIHELLPDGKEAEKIVGVEVLGDPHVGGRRVMKLEFDNGGSVAYKPRNSGIAAGFNDLLRWINENSCLLDLKTIETVCRAEYSWMEWIEPEGCSTIQEVSEYYRRAGMLICLFYATDIVDMHLENVIAYGDQPVVIDLETLAHPIIKSEYLITDWDTEDRETVLRTGAVPGNNPSNDSLDISCFSTSVVNFTSESHEFVNVNTDHMDIKEEKDVIAVGNNLPRYNGEVSEPSEHVEAIVDGFTDMYTFIMENSEEILAEDGPLSRMCKRNSRVSIIYRNSRSYSGMRKLLTHQPNLRTGLEFGIKVESLAKPILYQEVEEEAWKVYECERETLRNWNCPRFTADLDSNDLYYRGVLLIPDFFENKPIEQVRKRIRKFSEADLDKQADLVRRGFSE